MPEEETDEQFLARKDAEAAAEFAEAVQMWRDDKATGGGKPRIVEKGGDFGKVKSKKPE